jgi:hypothetical protein|tara:strand:+ start:190 stop:408 length:219 start_codon:yes stop_codon:yes gene_type:complete
MPKYHFLAGAIENHDLQIKKSKSIQRKPAYIKADINNLLNRVKISRKDEKIKNIRLVCVSLITVSSLAFFLI